MLSKMSKYGLTKIVHVQRDYVQQNCVQQNCVHQRNYMQQPRLNLREILS